MRRPLEGVRVLEVAQFTFVPAAGAVLADWGADVIKIEHPVTGDAQRGLVKVLGNAATVEGSSFAPIMEAPNRGKRSVGLGLDSAEARPVFEELVRRSDVFLTNYLPRVRTKLAIDVDDVRRINPDIIYVVGSGFGMSGPDSDTAAYDVTGFWARGGSADGVTPPWCRAGFRDAGGCLRRQHRRPCHRRRNRRGPLRAPCHRGVVGTRRVAAGRRSLGHPVQRESGAAHRRAAAQGGEEDSDARQSLGGQLSNQRRPVDSVGDAAADPVLAGVLSTDGL